MSVKHLTPVNMTALASDPATGSAGDVYFNTALGVKKVHNGTSWTYDNEIILPYAFSGTLIVKTGVLRIYNRSGSPWTIIDSFVYVSTAPVGASAVFGIRKNGAAASITLTVATATNSASSTTQLVIANGDYITVDISGVGTTTPGQDAMLTLTAVS